ncbi:MAG: ketopantoate reductase family protein [Bacillota bacterium]
MKIGMIGMGAIGCAYGAQLSTAFGDDFFAIANGRYYDDIMKNGIVSNGAEYKINVKNGDMAESADLIILLVKNYSLESAIADITPFVGDNTILLPLLNGITASETLRKAFPNNKVLDGLVIGIDATRLDRGSHCTSLGLVQFGEKVNTPPYSSEVNFVCDVLSKTQIPFETPEDMPRTTWKKFMMNVGCNQVSAVCDCQIFECCAIPDFYPLTVGAMQEVVNLAKAKGINLFESDKDNTADFLAKFVKSAKSSMHQDMLAKRKTEVESFGGAIIAMSEEFSLKTPINEFLVAVIKGKETKNGF